MAQERPARSEGLPQLLCADLNSKKLMVTGGLARSSEDVLDRSQHCWCERTCKQLGPDGQLAAARAGSEVGVRFRVGHGLHVTFEPDLALEGELVRQRGGTKARIAITRPPKSE